MNKYICPHCGAEGYSANENTKCWQCGLRPDEISKCETCTTHDETCKGCVNYSEYEEDDGK